MMNSGDEVLNVAKHLEETMSTDLHVRKKAESFLNSVERQPNYSLILLKLLESGDLSMQVRMAAAIAFKNFIKKYWKTIEDGEDNISQNDRHKIKELIVELMLHSPNSLQNQLSEAVSIIGKEDFPEKWESLLPQMIVKFNTGDFHLINGVLKTARSLFERYRSEVRSNKLFSEMNFVIKTFGQPLTTLLDATINLADQHSTNPTNLKIVFSSLLMICEIFMSLNCQDLPEFFEDNMAVWMANFHKLLKVGGNKIDGESEDDEEPGLIEQVKAQVCDNISLYASQYDEEFASYLPDFVTDVWQLLLATGPQVKYDMLASTAIQFLASVADRNQYKHLFGSPDTLQMLCEKVIIPNMYFRKCDEEQFSDNPEEYIRRDIEGSNALTRRKAACELVRALCKSFEGEVINNFSNFIGHLLNQYSTSPQTAWASKDAALFLVTSLASKGQTEKLGVTATTNLVNITDFFSTQVLPELQSQNVNELPVIKAGCIKYLMIFRGLFPPDVLRQSLNLLMPLLSAQSQVVHSYAAAAIDKMLLVKVDSKPVISKEHIVMPEQLVSNLLLPLSFPGSEENEYVMRALMRSCSCLQERLLPSMGNLVPALIGKLQQISKNPCKPHFNHYCFECICLCITIAAKADPSSVGQFESILFPVIQDILQNDIIEFLPYVFQVLALLLEEHSIGALPPAYMDLFPLLLSPILWERGENVPALTRLLIAYTKRTNKLIIESNKLSALLGVFQKLCASKNNDLMGFHLLAVICKEVPKEVLQSYMKQIFTILFQRLQSAKTVKYMRGLIIFFSRFMLAYSPDVLISIIDDIQANMFAMTLERVVVPNLCKITDSNDRHVVTIAFSQLITTSPALLSGNYAKFWCPIIEKIVEMLELPVEESRNEFQQFLDAGPDQGYQASYYQLVYAGRPRIDDLSGYLNAKEFLVANLHKLSSSMPGKISGALSSGLSPPALACLQKYFSEANLTLQ